MRNFLRFFTKMVRNLSLKFIQILPLGGGGIISVICLVLENYITLKECEQKEILKYRNDESVKSQLYNQHIISFQEHLAF